MSCKYAIMLKKSCKMMKLIDNWVKIIMKVNDVTLKISWLLLQLTVS